MDDVAKSNVAAQAGVEPAYHLLTVNSIANYGTAHRFSYLANHYSTTKN
jgi:hypothetical protein